jgi:hypothetical protein
VNDPNEGIEPMDAAQFYGERPDPGDAGCEPFFGQHHYLDGVCRRCGVRQGPNVVVATWFAIVFPVRGPETIARVLVIGGRIAAHSFGFTFVGQPWSEYRANVERNGWKVEELPHV